MGLSEEKTCYVSLRYFEDLELEPRADYVVHEVAHLFHNNKRRYVGLPPRGRCEWMLAIEFRKRELFAYAREVYSRIAARASSPRERKQLLWDALRFLLFRVINGLVLFVIVLTMLKLGLVRICS